MAAKEKEKNTEINRFEDCEREEENGTLCHSQMPNTSLAELNMLLVILSSYYPTEDEWNEENEQIVRDQVAATKTCISKLETKKREKHEPKLFGKKCFSSRFQTTIKDSRHGRRM
ncbi:unnamed protein product [Trifolium pratense]|uniref:Uncharacterized protein n=1 Tax=Trifolium pratense TaxID=57577 RepID=A0ACB0IH21_TRIPR|nr:unnamed protein product [Trifolium pratense]